ncbi:hypothetical protein F4780DRAFT_669730 [Xylariomycetidae sp. FL0641]|nr:hypothetical protein F4780DRAFT_669730 [Xylariomycetidae sp. FL0641]
MAQDGPPTRFYLEFQVLSDGLDTPAVQRMPLTQHYAALDGGFPQFVSLPPELRELVWLYLLQPRVIGARCINSETPPEPLREYREGVQVWPGGATIPVLLHVNRETRGYAMWYGDYEKAFAWRLPRVLAPDPPPYPAPSTNEWSKPQAYFSFAHDALFLLGELDPVDADGVMAPMAHFLDLHETRRVRRVAVAFDALRYGEVGNQQIFGNLFHVVDRFFDPKTVAQSDDRLFICVTPGDEWTHQLLGEEHPLVDDDDDEGGDAEGAGSLSGLDGASGSTGLQTSEQEIRRRLRRQEGNLVEKLWKQWYQGSIVQSSLINMKFRLIRETDLEKNKP